MTGPLVRAQRRTGLVVTAALAAVVVAALAAITWHGTTTAFDTWAFQFSNEHIGPGMARVLIDLSEPAIDVALLAMVVAGAASIRRYDAVVLAIAGPSIALALTELVLKPLVGRTLGPSVLYGDLTDGSSVAFPSGHETGVASIALVLALVAHSGLQRRGRMMSYSVLAGWAVLAGAGLVRNDWHYATDVIGAIAVSAAAVLSTALLVDRVVARQPDQLTRRS